MKLKLVSIVPAFALVALISCSGASEPSSRPTATAAVTSAPPTEGPTAIIVPTLLPTVEAEPTATPVPTATPEPTARPTPGPTPVPQPTPTPLLDEQPALVKFKGSIPSVNARVTDIRLFERGSDPSTTDDRVYRNTFDRTAARFVYAEISLAYPIPESRVTFDLETTYRRSDGSIFGSSTRDSYFESDWTSSSSARGRGWADPGKWPADTYTVELSVEGNLVASSQFIIVDEALPKTGPFQELREGLTWSRVVNNIFEQRALLALSAMLAEDQALATNLAALPWVSDDISESEAGLLEHLAVIAAQDSALAGSIAGLPWLADDINGDEWQAVKYLSLLSKQDTSVARSIASIPWVEDGIVTDESTTLKSLYRLARMDLALTKDLLEIPWVSEEMTEERFRAVQYLREITDQDTPLAQTVASYPWLSDDIGDQERWGLRYLKDIAAANPAMGAEIAALPWVSDDMAADEGDALRYLRDLNTEDPLLGASVAAMPFFTNAFKDQDSNALYSLTFLQSTYPDDFDLLVGQDWFLDGVSDEEASFITTLGHEDQYFTPPDLRDFVEVHHAESQQISLSLSGETTLTFIQAAPDEGNAEIVVQVEEAVKEIEAFMGVPFPTTEVILLFASGRDPVFASDWWGLHRGTHMVVQPGLARQGDTNRVLIHEVGHYYWGSLEAPLWFREGAPDFLASYVRDKLYFDTLYDREIYDLNIAQQYCDSVNMGTLQKLIDRLFTNGLAEMRAADFFICNYRVGERFFVRLFNTLGAEPFRAAFGELYQLSQDENRQITEGEIYSAFLKHTTASTEAAFKTLYTSVHGGDFSD